jgi:hypothetical protein
MPEKMPVLFVGHGNPMNVMEDNEFSRAWDAAGKTLPKPKVAICISVHCGSRVAHWSPPWTNRAQFMISTVSRRRCTRSATTRRVPRIWRNSAAHHQEHRGQIRLGLGAGSRNVDRAQTHVSQRRRAGDPNVPGCQ